MNYPIIQNYINGSNRPGRSLFSQGIVFHSTDDSGATAQNIRDYFNNHSEAKASAHATIDWDSIVEMIPETEVAWHAGPTANSRFIGVELCEPADGDDEYAKFTEVWDRAVWYAAKHLRENGWTTQDNVFSHRGISQMYGETNHTDPIGYFAKYGKTWDMFLADVDQELKGGGSLDVNQALQVLLKKGVISNIDYWQKVIETTKYVDVLIINAAQKLEGYEIEK